MIKFSLWIIAVMALLVMLLVLRGALLPVEHSLARERPIAAPVAMVAARIADVRAQPRWRRGVSAIEVIETSGSELRYVETGADGSTRFRFSVIDEASFVSRIDDPDLGYSGEWTISVRGSGRGSVVRIREDGAVPNPLFRFFAHDVLGYERSMRSYLDDLQRSFSNYGEH